MATGVRIKHVISVTCLVWIASLLTLISGYGMAFIDQWVRHGCQQWSFCLMTYFVYVAFITYIDIWLWHGVHCSMSQAWLPAMFILFIAQFVYVVIGILMHSGESWVRHFFHWFLVVLVDHWVWHRKCLLVLVVLLIMSFSLTLSLSCRRCLCRARRLWWSVWKTRRPAIHSMGRSQ